MKRRSILLAVTLILCSQAVKAQIRHVQGLKAVDAGVTFTELGVSPTASYLMYLSGKFSARGMITYESNKAAAINNKSAKALKIDLMGGYTFLNLGDDVFFNTYGGLVISYDNVEGAEDYNIDSGLNYGLVLMPEAEYFINDKLSLAVHLSIRYLIAENYGGIFQNPGFIIRYNFN
jgi:hypothetical protein